MGMMRERGVPDQGQATEVMPANAAVIAATARGVAGSSPARRNRHRPKFPSTHQGTRAVLRIAGSTPVASMAEKRHVALICAGGVVVVRQAAGACPDTRGSGRKGTSTAPTRTQSGSRLVKVATCVYVRVPFHGGSCWDGLSVQGSRARKCRTLASGAGTGDYAMQCRGEASMPTAVACLGHRSKSRGGKPRSIMESRVTAHPVAATAANASRTKQRPRAGQVHRHPQHERQGEYSRGNAQDDRGTVPQSVWHVQYKWGEGTRKRQSAHKAAHAPSASQETPRSISCQKRRGPLCNDLPTHELPPPCLGLL